MAKRLTKITTRTGDDGTTGLGTGERVAKFDARVEAIGDVDELNSAIGVLLAESVPDNVRAILSTVQHDLFDLGAELSIPGRKSVTEAHLARIDAATASFNASLPPLQEFILPGGSRAAAATHVARTVCRRAERRLCALAATTETNPLSQQYLNRASDLLFQLGRVINLAAGVAERGWQPRRSP